VPTSGGAAEEDPQGPLGTMRSFTLAILNGLCLIYPSQIASECPSRSYTSEMVHSHNSSMGSQSYTLKMVHRGFNRLDFLPNEVEHIECRGIGSHSSKQVLGIESEVDRITIFRSEGPRKHPVEIGIICIYACDAANMCPYCHEGILKIKKTKFNNIR
jgi:hypothetical protein